MPINLQGSGNIAEGWGRPPELQAPNISGLVHAILANRLERDKMTQESIAGTIKNLQSQREEQAYTDALQKAGLLPEGDYGGLGIKGGASLAALVQRQQALQAMEAHRSAMEARIGRGRGGGGGGAGAPADGSGPEFVYDKDGTKYLVVRTSKSVTYHRVPNQAGGGGGAPKLSPTEKGWAAPEIPGLSVNINAPDEPAQVLQPDVPPMPEPQGTPPPADTAAGHAQDYGKPVSDADVEALTWARSHPDDPRSVAILDKLGVPH